MWIIFIILGVVLVWGLCESGSRFSEPGAKDENVEVARGAAEKAQKEKELQDALARQKALEDKYFNSPLTRRIIDTISDGTGQLPEEITVYDDRVTGCTNGQMRNFGFAANRVPVFDQVHKCMAESGEEELLLRPQVALGNAINRILNGQYDVSDKAIRRHEQMGRSDVYIYFFHYYTSDHVLLRLKATNHW